MKSELNASWYPLLAAGFTLLLSSLAAADPATVIARESFPFAASDELALLKEEETVSIASRY
ncbi:MAG: hypothetical protein H8K05_00020, partial [Nitrospira sp.]|nr:hypothetical protein [Nitrospira sp.]